MCLITLAYRRHPDYPLVFAANRDEFYARPTAPAAFWEDAPDVLAGRDLQAGGTWCGVTRNGRIAAVTNFRDLRNLRPDAPSRGDLVAGFLRGSEHPEAYLARVAAEAARYNGFNLLVGDLAGLYYFSNQEGDIRALQPGVYGLSNHLLDTPWPKVVRARERLDTVVRGPSLSPEPLFDLLADEHRAGDETLPDTGVGLDLERVLSSVFIRSPQYGTRTSTVFWIDRRGTLAFEERTHALNGAAPVERSYRLDLSATRSGVEEA